jgi:hypothetical protein
MDKARVEPFWVKQYRLFGSRLNALVEECNALQEQAGDALCKDEELPEHIVKRMNDLCAASLDAYGFSYKVGCGETVAETHNEDRYTL